jgi:hypothetical protein
MATVLAEQMVSALVASPSYLTSTRIDDRSSSAPNPAEEEGKSMTETRGRRVLRTDEVTKYAENLK